jgi:ankyrin repeat protein
MCVRVQTDTPLDAAAFQGHLPVVQMLMEAEADVNARSDDGESPLHCAAFQGHEEICRALVCGGAQVGTVAREAASV